MSVARTRWAAIGAAVAVTLGAGGIGLVDAAKDTDERAVYTAIEPCRLLDTRPAKGVGGRTAPLGPGEVFQLTAHGDNGECAGIPNDTLALELNVTGLLNTAGTDFVIWSGAGNPPNASQLNLAPGAPPTPNSVTTELDGPNFSIRNKFGNAHVIIDIVGIYQDHTHDDRYYTETEVDAATTAALAVESEQTTVAVEDTGGVFVGPFDLANSLSVTVPGPGQVVLSASGYFRSRPSGLAIGAQCSISLDGEFDTRYRTSFEDVRADTSHDVASPFHVSRLVEVSGAGTVDAEFLCTRLESSVLVISRMSATYVP